MIEVSTYSIVDVLLFLFVLFGVVEGARRGLSTELAKLVGIVVAVWAGWRFYEPLGAQVFLMTRLEEGAAYAISFCLAILLALLVMMIVRSLLKHLLHFSFKGKVDRLGGAAAGGVGAIVLSIALVMLMGLVPSDYLHALFVEDSWVGQHMYQYLPTIYSSLSERYPELGLWEGDEDFNPDEVVQTWD